VAPSRPFLGIAVPAKTISTEALRSIAFPGLEDLPTNFFQGQMYLLQNSTTDKNCP
jgi:hypothetical protein